MQETKEINRLPDSITMKRICKAVSAMEIMLCEELELRQFSYEANWDVDEEVFEMRNDSDLHMLVLFRPEGCVISGIHMDYYDWEKEEPRIEELTSGLPDVFHEFMFGEPIRSIKSTFCIWNTDGTTWCKADTAKHEDGAAELLWILDADPKTYQNYCAWYYEKEIPYSLVEHMYRGEPITMDFIKSFPGDREDLQAIKAELDEIGYPITL